MGATRVAGVEASELCGLGQWNFPAVIAAYSAIRHSGLCCKKIWIDDACSETVRAVRGPIRGLKALVVSRGL